MDAIVTARVPVEIKEQGNAALKRIGSTPTELINAAYAYVLQYGELPQKQAEKPTTAKKKVLKGNAARDFRKKWNEVALDLPDDYRKKPFKQLLAEARDERYESLA